MDGSGIDAVPRPSIFIFMGASRLLREACNGAAAPPPIFRPFLRADPRLGSRSMAGVSAAPYVILAAASCSPLSPFH
jgi:hypothetical protein